MARRRALTIRLIRSGARAIVKQTLGLKTVLIKSGLPFTGTIYYQPSATKLPSWLGFLSTGAATPIAGIFSAQASALLMLRKGNRQFAISFGHAWQWLEEEAIERRFGLIAALNCIEDDQVKVVDAQQIDSLALNQRVQSSHSSGLDSFGLDVRRDLMKAIAGRPSDKSIGSNIMGADALRVTCKIEFAALGDKCEQLLQLSKGEQYKKKYPWVDNITAVKSPKLRADLDNALIKRLNARQTEGIYLAPPRIRDIAFDEEYRFLFDAPDERRADIELDDYLAKIGTRTLKLDDLKKESISVYVAGSPQPVDKFNIYSGIVFEEQRNSELYCLIDSDWFSVSKSHVDDVNAAVSLIGKASIKLPPAFKGEVEGAYNKRAAPLIPALCLDVDLINYGGGHSKVEVCDLLTQAPVFIHVKRAHSSQLLSHLFNQGVVSGQFLLEQKFRTLCAAQFDVAYKNVFEVAFKPEATEIMFAIISKNANALPGSLPFFSKQTLVNAADLLGKFKYNVSIAGVSVV